MVMPGSVQRDPNSLKVTFTITMLKAQWMFLTKAFCRICSGRAGRCGAGRAGKRQSYPREEVLAKHDENYTPPEVEKAMELTTVARRVFIRTQHHDARNCNGLLCLALGIALLLSVYPLGAWRAEMRA